MNQKVVTWEEKCAEDELKDRFAREKARQIIAAHTAWAMEAKTKGD